MWSEKKETEELNVAKDDAKEEETAKVAEKAEMKREEETQKAEEKKQEEDEKEKIKQEAGEARSWEEGLKVEEKKVQSVTNGSYIWVCWLTTRKKRNFPSLFL